VRVVIVANGVITEPASARAVAAAADRLLCADGGTRHVLGWGLWPAVVVGDMDSLDGDILRRLEAAGVRLARHPAHKDATDLELALDLALDEGATEIIILGALGGRLDQTLANILLLTEPRFQRVPLSIQDGSDRLFVGRSPIVLEGKAGDLVSLIPLSPAVSDIRTAGLEYPLAGETLTRGSTRGVSNVMLGEAATVTFGDGLLLVSQRTSGAA